MDRGQGSDSAVAALERILDAFRPRHIANLFKARPDVSPELDVLDGWADATKTRAITKRNTLQWRFAYERDREALAALRAHPGRLGLSAVLSVSASGYVRERAVQNLAQIGPDGLPFVLIRCREWVDKIKGLAVETALAQFPAATDEQLFFALVQLPNLAHQRVLDPLRSEAETRVGFLSSARNRLPSHSRLHLLRLRWSGPDEQWSDIFSNALKSRDMLYVAGALKILATLEISIVKGLVDTLATSRCRQARLRAVQVARTTGRDDLLRTAVDDTWWRVRSLARLSLFQPPPADFVAHYRERLPRLSAIGGFGETAPASALQELLPILHEGADNAKVAVLRVLANRGTTEAGPEVLPLLHHPKASVVAAAVRTAATLGLTWQGDALLERWRAAEGPCKGSLAKALVLLSYWDRAATSLQMVAEGASHDVLDPILVHRPRVRPPRPEELDAIGAALVAASPRLEGWQVDRVRQELDTWRKR